MDEEKDAFYVVRKGDIIGIYKSFGDCQAQASSSSVSVFKGYGLKKKAEEFLISHGLKNAAYSIHAADVQNDLFGKLDAFPFQQSASPKGKAFVLDFPPKRYQGVVDSMSEIKWVFVGMPSVGASTNTQQIGLPSNFRAEPMASSSVCASCVLEFDGASRGNPGPAGAGAVLRAGDGSMVCRLRQGLGIATNNVAEYQAVILGLKHALRKGYKHIRVQGDSNLVVMQVDGKWKIKAPNLADLCKEAKELKEKFTSFQIKHVLREFNSEADAVANQAVNLREGQVEEDCIRNPELRR